MPRKTPGKVAVEIQPLTSRRLIARAASAALADALTGTVPPRRMQFALRAIALAERNLPPHAQRIVHVTVNAQPKE